MRGDTSGGPIHAYIHTKLKQIAATSNFQGGGGGMPPWRQGNCENHFADKLSSLPFMYVCQACMYICQACMHGLQACMYACQECMYAKNVCMDAKHVCMFTERVCMFEGNRAPEDEVRFLRKTFSI